MATGVTGVQGDTYLRTTENEGYMIANPEQVQ